MPYCTVVNKERSVENSVHVHVVAQEFYDNLKVTNNLKN